MTSDEKHAAKKARVHTRYYNKAGKQVPGVTTITGVMDKPALVKWANSLGLRGIDVKEYVDELAIIGKLAHYIIECYIKKVKPDYGDYTPNQVSLAENSVIKFFDWEKETGFNRDDVIFSEQSLVSEKHQFGGTLDIYTVLQGKKTLLDLKTCKGVYGEHKTQVGGGYRLLLEENGHPVEQVRILRIGRTEDEGFEDVRVDKQDLHGERFLTCRALYTLNKQIGW